MCDFEMEQGEHFISNVRASLRIFVRGGGQTQKLPSQGGKTIVILFQMVLCRILNSKG